MGFDYWADNSNRTKILPRPKMSQHSGSSQGQAAAAPQFEQRKAPSGFRSEGGQAVEATARRMAFLVEESVERIRLRSARA
jgi:hypothetical protein